MPPKPSRATITLQRSGGFAGVTLRATVDTDELEQEERERYLGLLEQLDLSALAEKPARSAGGGVDRFQYDLELNINGQHYGLRYGEKALPGHLKPLIQMLLDQARRRP